MRAIALFPLLKMAQAQEELCIEGFIMDKFCIERGTLLDMPSIETLREPEKHSIHCLIDVPSCFNSGFEVLIDPGVNSACGNASTIYSRAFTLDAKGNQLVRETAAQVGSCTECTGEGNQVRGFRAAVFGTLEEGGSPPLFRVNRLEHVTPDSVGSMAGCGDTPIATVDVCLQEAGGMVSTIYIHGGLMVASWGFLLPLGVLLARCLKHRPGAVWFRFHRAIQLIGITVATIGWVIALMNFNVFQDIGKANFIHGIFGMVTMCLGIGQPLNAVVRPHVPKENETKSSSRQLWEILHKGAGYFAVVSGTFTIVIGTTLIPFMDAQMNVRIVYAVLLLVLLFIGAYLYGEKRQSHRPCSNGSRPLYAGIESFEATTPKSENSDSKLHDL